MKRPLEIPLVARDVRALLDDHPTIATVACIGVVFSVALSVALSLIGTSVRASLISALELESRDAILVEGRGRATPCSIDQVRCDHRDGKVDERVAGAIRDAFGSRDVGELVDAQSVITTAGYAPRTVRLLAIDDAWMAMQPVRWLAGRGFSAAAAHGDRRETLIGHTLADSITITTGRMLAEIRLDGKRHSIVGVIESGATAITTMDNAIIIPRQSRDLFARLRDGQRQMLVRLKPGPAGTGNRATLIGVLRQAEHLRPRDSLMLEVRGLEEHMGFIDTVWQQLNSALWRIALLLALTASVGVGALQFTVAAARCHEMGVRRAVGARKRELIILGVQGALWFMCFSSSVGVLLAVLACSSVAFHLGVPIVGFGAAVFLGVLPALVCGATAGGLAFAHFARMHPSQLLGRAL